MSTDLWPITGGQLVRHHLDLAANEASVDIDVLEHGVTTSHQLHFQGVHEFRFFSEIEPPWEGVDVTLPMLEAKGERLQLWLVLWEERGAGLIIEFERGTLDGSPLEP